MKKLKIGVFGAWRGNNYIDLFSRHPEAEVVAVCDKNIGAMDEKDCMPDTALFTDFDTFLSEGKRIGMNAVFLANYFHQHTPFAIRAMEAGMDVVSECTAASTLQECCLLCETVERTGRKYLLAENYPFSVDNRKMNKIVKSGALGTLLYAEGEYNHSGNLADLQRLTPGKYHWRAWMPRTYYVTHALGPVMYMTDSVPVYVSGRAAHSGLMEQISDFRHNDDGVGMLFCEMSNGMIARVTGCTAMASDYSRYRIVGDVASVESGHNIPEDRVRMFWFAHTKPEDEPENCRLIPTTEEGEAVGGHGGGDGQIVQNVIDCFLHDEEPFFDVYRSVAMSAAAILAWRSCLNHGENMRIPDFRDPAQRETVRNDTKTPFPDENGNGADLPASLREAGLV